MSTISTASEKQQRADDIVRRFDSTHGDALDAEKIALDFPELRSEIVHAVRRWNMVNRARKVHGSSSGSNGPATGDSSELATAKPSRFGPFALIERLGSGSFGTVWRATDTRVSEEVALKLAHADCPSPRQLKRSQREAETNARLTHPNIIPVHEFGQEAGRFYIVSKLLEGETLGQLLYRERPPISRAVEIASVLARALDHAHGLGVVHRDIKPANIMIDKRGNPHIGDFGLAKTTEPEDQLTREGDVFGTPTYMSPEQAAGDNQRVSGKSDVYSLGVVLYRMLTGELPFRGHHAMLRYQVLYDTPPSPRKFFPGITADLETICLKCLEKRPKDRYTTASELADDLDRTLAQKPISAKPRGSVYRLRNWVRRKPWRAAAAAWLICMVGILTVVTVREVRLRKIAQISHADALLAVAETVRASRSPGHQWQVLNSLDRAEQLLGDDATPQRTQRLQRNRLAAYSSPDWQVAEPLALNDRFREQVAFDSELTRFAFLNRKGNISIRSFGSEEHIELRTKCFVTPTLLALAPSGKFVALGNSRGLTFWDLDTQQIVWRAPHPGRHNWCFHESRAYNCSQNEVVVFDLDAGGVTRHPIRRSNRPLKQARIAKARSAKPKVAPQNVGLALAVTRVNEQVFLAIGSHDSGLVIAQLADEIEPRRTLFDDAPGVLRFSNDGLHLAGGYRQGGIHLWTNPTAENPRVRSRVVIPAHRGHVVNLHFHPTRPYLVSNSIDGTSRLWDFAGSELMQAEEWVAQFHQSGQQLAVFDRSRIGLANFLDSPIRDVIETNDAHEFAISTDGKLLVGKSKGRLWLRDIASNKICDWIPVRGRTQRLYTLADQGRCYVIAPSPFGIARVEVDLTKQEFVDEGDLWMDFPHDGIQIDVSSHGDVLIGKRRSGDISIIRANGDDYLVGSHQRIAKIAISADGSVAASCAPDGIKVWDVGSSPNLTNSASNTRPNELYAIGKTVGASFIALSPDGRVLAVGDGKGYTLHDVHEKRLIKEFHRTGIGPSAGVSAFSPAGRILALAGAPNEIRLIDFATGDDIAILPSPHRGAAMPDLQFGPRGNWLYHCQGSGIERWDISKVSEVIGMH